MFLFQDPKIPRSRRSRTIFPKSKIPNISRTISYSFIVRLVERVFLPRKFKISKIQNNKYRYLFDICYFKLPKIQDFKHFQNNKLLIRGSFGRARILIPKIPRSRRSRTTFEKIQNSKPFQNNKSLVFGSFDGVTLVLIARNGTEFIRAGSWSAD